MLLGGRDGHFSGDRQARDAGLSSRHARSSWPFTFCGRINRGRINQRLDPKACGTIPTWDHS
jgi:hypothetical protein